LSFAVYQFWVKLIFLIRREIFTKVKGNNFMSDEKLDLILTVVSGIKLKVDNLDTKVDSLDTKANNLDIKVDSLDTKVNNLDIKVDNLDTKVNNLDTKVNNLESQMQGVKTDVRELRSEFTDFKKQVIELFVSVQNRFAVLEKQMVAIGVELKAEIRTEVEAVGAKIDRLEKQILLDRTDTVENRMEIREIKQRLTQIENTIGLTI